MNQVNEESTATEKELDDIVEVRSQQLLECSEDILTIGSEGLVEFYRGRNHGNLPTLAMEDAAQQSLTQRVSQRITDFFRWVRDMVGRMVEFITGNKDKSAEAKKLSAAGKNMKGIDAPIDLEKVDRNDMYSASYHSLATARNTFASRKQTVIDAATELAKKSSLHAAFFYDRVKEAHDLIDVLAQGLTGLLPIVSELMEKLEKVGEPQEGMDLIEKAWRDFQELSTALYHDPDPNTGVKTLLVKLSEKMHGGQVSSAKLMEKIIEVLDSSEETYSNLKKAGDGIQDALDGFSEQTALHKDKPPREGQEGAAQEFVRSIGNVTKMLTQSLGLVRQFSAAIHVPDSILVQIKSMIVAHDHVTAVIKQAETNENLDDEAKKLLAEMKKDFT